MLLKRLLLFKDVSLVVPEGVDQALVPLKGLVGLLGVYLGFLAVEPVELLQEGVCLDAGRLSRWASLGDDGGSDVGGFLPPF